MPPGWHYMGRFYCDDDGKTLYEHPNREQLIADYLAAENAKIGDYNREV